VTFVCPLVARGHWIRLVEASDVHQIARVQVRHHLDHLPPLEAVDLVVAPDHRKIHFHHVLLERCAVGVLDLPAVLVLAETLVSVKAELHRDVIGHVIGPAHVHPDEVQDGVLALDILLSRTGNTLWHREGFQLQRASEIVGVKSPTIYFFGWEAEKSGKPTATQKVLSSFFCHFFDMCTSFSTKTLTETQNCTFAPTTP
jgi:hypothetical protein